MKPTEFIAKPRLTLLTSSVLASLAMLSACGGGSSGTDSESTLASVQPGMQIAAVDAAASSAELGASAPATEVQAASVDAVAGSAAASSATTASPTAKILAATAITSVPTVAKAATATATATPVVATASPVAVVSTVKTTTTQPTSVASVQLPVLTQVAVAVTPIAITTAATTALIPTFTSIWNQTELLKTALISNGNGLTTTASSVPQMLLPSQGIFFGYRDAKEDWAGLASRVKSNADLANWIKTEKTRVDGWIAKGFERADLIGGWTQAYIDPKTGLSVTWTPSSAEPANGVTDAEKKFKGAWVAYSRGYNITQMQAAARLFKLTGEVKYGEWAAKQLDFYSTNYTTWPLRTAEGRSTMYQQGLDEAVDTFALLDTARLLETYSGTTRSKKWRDGLFTPLATNLKSTSAPMSNIALWHNAAIAAIAMRYRDTALLDYAQNGSQGIKAVLAYALTADNFWIEGTFAYNNYVLDVMSKMLVQASIEGYAARFTAEREQALKLLLASFDYRFDNNTLPNPNDSSSTQPVIAQPAHWNLFRIAPTYWGLDKANKWRTWESLLDVPATVPTTEPVIPTPMTRNFPTLRQAVLRAGTWQAFVHYGQANGNHVQEELTTFELQEGGTPVAVDPGTVSYGSPYHKGYFSMGPANNVPLVDGAGQTIWAKGNLLTFTAAESRLVVEQPKYQADASVTRGYRLSTAGFADQSKITVISGATKRLGVAFSTACDVALGSGTTPATPVLALPAVSAMTYWTKVSMFSGQAKWQALLTCGSKRYSMSISGPANQRIYLAKAPNTPMPSERNTIYYEVQGSTAFFETEFRAIN